MDSVSPEAAELALAALLPPEISYRGSITEGSYTFDFAEIEVTITIEPRAVTVSNRELPRKVVDKLRVDLRQILAEDENEHEGRDENVQEAKENVTESNGTYGLEYSVDLIVRLIDETDTQLQTHRSNQLLSNTQQQQQQQQQQTFNLPDPRDEINTMDLTDLPSSLLHLTIPQLLATHFPSPFWHVTNVENILTRARYKLFYSLQAYIRGQLTPPLWDEWADRTQWWQWEWDHSAGPTISPSATVTASSRQGEIQGERPGSEAHHQATHLARLTHPSLTLHAVPKDRVPHIAKHGFTPTNDSERSHTEPPGGGYTFDPPIYCTSHPSAALLTKDYGSAEAGPSELLSRKIVVCASLLAGAEVVDDSASFEPRVLRQWYAHVGLPGNAVPVRSSRRLKGIHAISGMAAEAVLPVYVIHLEWDGKAAAGGAMTMDRIYGYLRTQVAPDGRLGGASTSTFSNSSSSSSSSSSKSASRKDTPINDQRQHLSHEQQKKKYKSGTLLKSKDDMALFPAAEKKAKMEERRAQANKHFTYGFGAAGAGLGNGAGRRKVGVEKVGERGDDDEENWGDYQVGLRGGGD